MKRFFTVFLIFLIPLTLASDTQHRFKVYVEVNGDDERAVNIVFLIVFLTFNTLFVPLAKQMSVSKQAKAVAEAHEKTGYQFS